MELQPTHIFQSGKAEEEIEAEMAVEVDRDGEEEAEAHRQTQKSQHDKKGKVSKGGGKTHNSGSSGH